MPALALSAVNAELQTSVARWYRGLHWNPALNFVLYSSSVPRLSNWSLQCISGSPWFYMVNAHTSIIWRRMAPRSALPCIGVQLKTEDTTRPPPSIARADLS
ncbi:hypothetical protein PMIN06_009772 [Paraphaeosphaeria minitans]